MSLQGRKVLTCASSVWWSALNCTLLASYVLLYCCEYNMQKLNALGDLGFSLRVGYGYHLETLLAFHKGVSMSSVISFGSCKVAPSHLKGSPSLISHP